MFCSTTQIANLKQIFGYRLHLLFPPLLNNCVMLLNSVTDNAVKNCTQDDVYNIFMMIDNVIYSIIYNVYAKVLILFMS